MPHYTPLDDRLHAFFFVAGLAHTFHLALNGLKNTNDFPASMSSGIMFTTGFLASLAVVSVMRPQVAKGILHNVGKGAFIGAIGAASYSLLMNNDTHNQINTPAP